MEKFLSMAEGTTSPEISNIKQMDKNLLKEFIQKKSVWDYHSRDEYTTKNASEKEILIIKYYNEMLKGKNL